jgi:hypothetical protein
MKRTAATVAVVVLGLAGAGGLPGCKSDPRRGGSTGGVKATDGVATRPDAGEPTVAPATSPDVKLTNEDLAPVDAYVKRRVWYVGDDIEVFASREYFWQYVSFIAAKGVAQREDHETPDGLVVTVTYVGGRELISEETAPRILIGTGVTLSARHRVTVRFVKTRDPNVPVRLRIAATGNASMGRGAEKLRRGESQIVAGCALVRGPSGRYEYQEQ